MDQWWGGKGGQGQGWGGGNWKGAAWKGAQPKHQPRPKGGGIIQRLDQDLLHTRGDIQQLRTDKEQLTAEKNSLVIEKNQLQAEKDAALSRAVVAEKMLETIQNEKQEMVDKHSAETAKASTMLTEVNAAWHRDTKQWEEKLKTTKRMLEANQDSEYSLREKLRGERDKYKDKSDRLEKALETEQRDRKIASSKLQDVEKENGKLKKRLSRLESQQEKNA
ncbi:hypothetical protein AK812_SmicGene38226 [Symbiodinium microadriaticum]|uniref:Uncharacterized protein n=1 Tax=Symbiodinium microadriaticum TaxID=2951 RepID=A0A1Q9CEA6_SYMMI|nr:hypothetical protein AK812_SmicGene38226 [Symbiodinium microadriaticum]